MVLSTAKERTSLNRSVDNLMTNTVEEASRRRSNPHDEMQRILAYTAQLGAPKRATPLRQGTGREVTARPVEFRKRVAAYVPAEFPEQRHLAPHVADCSAEEGTDASAEIMVMRGRRTGVRMRLDVPKDEHGLEKLIEFWMAEEESTRVSMGSKAGSVASNGSVLSHGSRRADSFADDRSVDASAATQVDASSMSDTPTSSQGRRSTRSSSAKSSSSVASSAASNNSSVLDSPSDTQRLDDSPNGLDASKQRLTFGSGDKRLSTLSADSISPTDSERAKKRHSRVSFADSGGKRKSSVSFARTPRLSNAASAAAQSPESDGGMPDFDQDDGSLPGSPELDAPPPARRASDIAREKAAKAARKKRKAEEGKLVDGHEKMGRASYSTTDTYAKKKPRLSEIAPRPVVDENARERRSKRRKLRPLQYWRGERVEYDRGASAAVPEVVDLQIRSPEATPWRRKPPKSQQTDAAEPTTADSKAKTVRKAKKAKKAAKMSAKATKPKTAAASKAAVPAATAADTDDKENQPVSKKAPPAADAVAKKKTPFFIFCTEKRGEVREAHPDMAITEQAKVLGRMWGALSDKDKNRYQQLSAAN